MSTMPASYIKETTADSSVV